MTDSESPKPTRPIVVLGGTGHYGRKIVSSLVARHEPVRVLSREPARARQVLGPQPDILRGDLTAPSSVDEALDGAQAVVVAVSAANRQSIRQRLKIELDGVLGMLERAARGGVTRVAYLSGYDVREDFARELGLVDFVRPMLEVEAALSESKLEWTVLGCAPSMEIFFAMIRGDTMTVPGGGPPALPTVSADDVGEIAAQVALRSDLAGRRIRLTGPEALSFPEAARRISTVWGRTVRYRPIPLFPLRVASWITWPFSPYLAFLSCAVRLLKHFPEQVAAEVPADHASLRQLFQYVPTSLEVEARQRG